ncbi:MAG: tRNA 2-thiouridine(34) synthase MnmA [Candidatus Paceibacteria bacterium]
MKAKTVFVGLSGGVDSSVSAALLKEQGYNVVGVFIKVWHPDFMVCNWEEERVDAMRVAAKLDIPFLTCDAQVAYRDAVASYFIESYRQGLTPNPDVLCNKEVKFGVFLNFAKAHGADFVATGHYVQVDRSKEMSVMRRAVDTQKDQSYFLWTLRPEQLEYTLFPVGHLPKSEVRELATKFNLPTAMKKDSQGICFLGQVDIPDFLSHYIDLKSGEVLLEDGLAIGVHKGALVYTVGQRHGFTITHKDFAGTIFYVINKNIANNTLVVSTTPPKTKKDVNLTLRDYVLRNKIEVGEVLEAQTRYRQTPFLVTVISTTDTTLTVAPKEIIETPALGQSCVLYKGNECIGGGIIS